MQVAAPPLTHIFTALFRDGSQIVQHPDDKPIQPRPDGSGSSFTDVERRIDEVRAFFLECGSEEGPDKHMYMVDLDDGHFEIDNVPVAINPDAEIVGPRRLVYFRRVGHTRRTQIATGKVESWIVRRSYHLGWEAPGPNGTIVRAVIGVGLEDFTVS